MPRKELLEYQRIYETWKTSEGRQYLEVEGESYEVKPGTFVFTKNQANNLYYILTGKEIPGMEGRKTVGRTGLLFQSQPSAIPYADLPPVRQSRDSVRQQAIATGAWSAEEVDAGMAVLDAYALQVSKWYGISPREWYARAFGGVQAGGMPVEGLFQQAAPIFYSHLERTLANLPQEKLTVGQLEGLLSKAGVKPDELTWTQLKDWMDDKGKDARITRAEALEFVRQNEVRVEEVKYGGDLDTVSQR